MLPLGETPEGAAARIRDHLGVTRQAQESWSSDYEALNEWRNALESRGVLVFQSTGLPVEEARGFSISQSPLPAVVVNSADTPYARIFSMIHELVHLALRRGGLCDMLDDAARPPEEQKVEVFCNQVAGVVLLPTQWIATDELVTAHPGMEWTDQELRLLSRRYRVSREVVLRRLLNSGRTTSNFYAAKREQFQREYRQRREESPGFAPPHSTAVGRAGQFFARLVLESYHRELITSVHVAEYLDVKLKHLPKIEMAVALPGRAAREV
jgi:Zn-dependent peptidase ImmA (M78 family)